MSALWDEDAPSDALLAAAGAFQRGTGLLSRRRLVDLVSREVSAELLADAIGAVPTIDVGPEVAAIALAAGLTALQASALEGVARGFTQADVARELGCSRQFVQRLLHRARRRIRKIAGGPDELPCSARALYWLVVRETSRLIYPSPR